VPVDLLTPAGPSFSASLDSLLAPRLKPNEALYALLRRHNTSPRLVAVTYVPDSAPVRQKMLFASSRLSLVRELGSEHFRDTIFATAADELSARGFEKHDAHAKVDAPLTEEERSLGEVKRAEAEAGMGTGTKEIHLSKTMAMPVGETAIEALKGLGEGGDRVLVMLVSFLVHSGWDLRFVADEEPCRKSTPRPKPSSWSRTTPRRAPSPS
jgi:twinfilin